MDNMPRAYAYDARETAIVGLMLESILLLARIHSQNHYERDIVALKVINNLTVAIRFMDMTLPEYLKSQEIPF